MMGEIREIALEQLLGRVVRSPGGRPVGRIKDLRAEPEGDEYVVHEVVIGELGLMAKLLGMAGQLLALRSIGLSRRYRRRAVRWSWIDWSDPEHPRFRASTSPGEQ
jgi:hypothetical protein